MQLHYSDQVLTYDGSQLSPHWIFKTFGLLGDSLVAFCGPCDVTTDKMVDLVDVRDKKNIVSKNMLHFLGEFFGGNLRESILEQRLLITLAQQELTFRAQEKKPMIVRGGNDLYDNGAKLSVAIVTASPVSTLMHFGINIVSEGTPIKTRGLEDYGIEAASFAKSILESFKDERKTIDEARAKVRPVY